MMADPLKLHRYAQPAINIDEAIRCAIARAAGSPLQGFVYTTVAANLVIATGTGELMVRTDAGTGAQRLDEVFEWRLFNADLDALWTRDGTTGTLEILCDNENVLTGLPKAEVECRDILETRCHEYLLWGDFEKSEGDWSLMSTPRIGGLWVPTALTSGRSTLRAREYFAVCDDGNVAFIAERLLGLAPAVG